ncbi:MAG TPA: hypothetical protein VK179_13795 [Bacteroidales bacterium]|nr:hypothetical protein [Bacteroidales bacterium]
MDKSEIELLIDNKVKDAKLDIADKRFNHLSLIVTILLVVMGIGIPIWQSYNSSERIDKALEDMRVTMSDLKNDQKESSTEIYNRLTENQEKFISLATSSIDKETKSMQDQFNELAGIQLRKPEIIVLYKGKSLENANILLTSKEKTAILELKNVGTATARNVYIQVYTKDETDLGFDWLERYNNQYIDEIGYKVIYSSYEAYAHLDPKAIVTLQIEWNGNQKVNVSSSALMKLFFEQPEPKVYNFTFEYKKD